MTTLPFKAKITYQNGEIPYPKEYDMDALNVPFSRVGFTSDNVEDAIAETVPQQFYFRVIQASQTLTIPSGREMMIHPAINTMEVYGSLTVDGTLHIFTV